MRTRTGGGKEGEAGQCGGQEADAPQPAPPPSPVFILIGVVVRHGVFLSGVADRAGVAVLRIRRLRKRFRAAMASAHGRAAVAAFRHLVMWLVKAVKPF